MWTVSRYIDIKIEHLWVYEYVQMWHRKGPSDLLWEVQSVVVVRSLFWVLWTSFTAALKVGPLPQYGPSTARTPCYQPWTLEIRPQTFLPWFDPCACSFLTAKRMVSLKVGLYSLVLDAQIWRAKSLSLFTGWIYTTNIIFYSSKLAGIHLTMVNYDIYPVPTSNYILPGGFGRNQALWNIWGVLKLNL